MHAVDKRQEPFLACNNDDLLQWPKLGRVTELKLFSLIACNTLLWFRDLRVGWMIIALHSLRYCTIKQSLKESETRKDDNYKESVMMTYIDLFGSEFWVLVMTRL